MNCLLNRGIIAVVLILFAGMLIKASAETPRQPTSLTTVKSPVIEMEVKAPTVKSPIIRQPVFPPSLLRAPAVAEPTVRHPVITEPGIRIGSPKGLVVSPDIPVRSASDPSLPTTDTIPKSQRGLQVDIEQSRQRQTQDPSFGSTLKKSLSEGYDTKSTARKTSTGERNLRDQASQVQQNNEAKADLREQMNGLRDQISKMPPGEERDAMEGQLDSMEDELETMSDLSEIDAMNLQEALNEQSQAMQILSNIMKNQHDTLKTIINNLK